MHTALCLLLASGIYREPALTIRLPPGAVCAALSPDAKRIAGTVNNQVKVWDAANGREMLSLRLPRQDFPIGVLFSADGSRIVTVNAEGTISVWDASTSRALAAFKSQGNVLSGLAISPDGTRLAIGADDRKDHAIRLLDATNGKELLTLKGHTAALNCVAFSPDGMRVASTSDDNTVQVWDLASRRNMITFEGHSRPVIAAAFSPDGKRIASADRNSNVRVWDASSGQELFAITGIGGTVNSLAFSPDGQWIATAGFDTQLWDAKNGQLVLNLIGPQNHQALSVSFSPDSKRLATASENNTVRVWQIAPKTK